MSTAQSLQERVIKGSLITLTLTFLGSVFAYLIRILYSHTLTVEDYGLFYAVFGLLNIIIGYGDLGFGYSIVYLLPKYLKVKEYSKAWNTFIYAQAISFLMSVIAATALALSAQFLAKYYFKVAGSENLIYIFCIYLITLSILNGLIQVFTGMQKVKYYSSITVSRWFLTFVFSILFFLFDFPNIIFYAFAWAFGHIITTAIFLFLFISRHNQLTGNKIIFESVILKKMFPLAYPVLLENFIVTSMAFTEIFFLTLIKGVKDVGVYNIIYPLASIPIILLAPVNSLILPLVSHLMEGEKERISYIVNRSLEIVPFIGIYFSLFLITFPSSIVGLVFGQKWLGLIENPIVILSIGSIAFLTSEILGTIAIGTGKIKARLKANAVLAVFNICLNIILIGKLGVLGVVITYSLTRCALSVWCLKIIKTSVPFQIPFKFYLKMLIFSTTTFLTIKLLGISPKNWLELIISGIIYTIIFVFLGLILKIYDKKLLLMIIPKRKSTIYD